MLKLSHFSLALILLLAACQAAPTATLAPTQQALLSVATPAAGQATLTGLLVRAADGSPYIGARVFVGQVLGSTDGQPDMLGSVGLDSPLSVTDRTGRFVMADLKPGRYILTVLVPPGEFIMLQDPADGSDMLVELQAGAVTDLGELLYNFDLPDSPD